MTSPPPPLSPAGAGDFWDSRSSGLGLWRLGRHDTLELMRVAPMCVADFLNEQFETPLLVEGLAAPAVIAHLGRALVGGHQHQPAAAEAAPGRGRGGGPPALIAALGERPRAPPAPRSAPAPRSRGSGSRTARRWACLGGRGDGGVTASASTPRRSSPPAIPSARSSQLIAPGTLPIRIEDEYRRIRMRGTAAKVHLALAGPLELAARPGSAFESIRIGGGHVDDLERAFDAVKYRERRRQAAPGGPRAHRHGPQPGAGRPPRRFDPGQLRLPRRRRRLDRGAPLGSRRSGPLRPSSATPRRCAIASSATSCSTPADLAERYALTGGQLHHGEPALDQLLVLRPTPSSGALRDRRARVCTSAAAAATAAAASPALPACLPPSRRSEARSSPRAVIAGVSYADRATATGPAAAPRYLYGTAWKEERTRPLVERRSPPASAASTRRTSGTTRRRHEIGHLLGIGHAEPFSRSRTACARTRPSSPGREGSVAQ